MTTTTPVRSVAEDAEFLNLLNCVIEDRQTYTAGGEEIERRQMFERIDALLAAAREDMRVHFIEENEALNAAYHHALRRAEKAEADLAAERAKAATLRGVLEVVRQYPDFDAPDSVFGVMMDEALAGKEPVLLGAIDALASGRAPERAKATAVTIEAVWDAIGTALDKREDELGCALSKEIDNNLRRLFAAAAPTAQAEKAETQPVVECALCDGHGCTHYSDGEWEGKCKACDGTGIAQPAQGEVPLPEPLEINWPELNSNALGCGIEDRGIHDRYDAAAYGWNDGVARAIERVPEQIFDADQLRTYGDAREAAGRAKALAERGPT